MTDTLEHGLQNGQHWRHVKRGSTYEIVEWDGSFQCSGDMDQEPVVIYRVLNGTATYVRPLDEFCDGRFVKVKDADD